MGSYIIIEKMIVTRHFLGTIRESVDSLRRDGADARIT